MNNRKLGRYDLSEMSFSRLISALNVRVKEIPHSINWYFSPKANRNRQQIRKLWNIHEGKRCFIVANGPSLKNTNLNLLNNEISFGLNRIYLHFSETTFRPTYYLAFNELILEQFVTEIRHLSMLKILNWNRCVQYDMDDPTTVFLKSKMVFKDWFQKDLTRPIVVGGSVTFVALQIAYYMGFQKVILVGLDHNYVEKGTPNQTEVRKEEQDESHFHPNYFPKGIKWQLPDLVRSEIDFEISRRVYENAGREVVDATIGGKCQIFKKVEYLSLFD